jgi:hypothetical protein
MEHIFGRTAAHHFSQLSFSQVTERCQHIAQQLDIQVLEALLNYMRPMIVGGQGHHIMHQPLHN